MGRRHGVPDGTRVYAVGDVHGRSDLLSALLGQIEADAAGAPTGTTKVLVFVGDYVDRGPDSRGVIERFLTGLPTGFETRFLKGNHEDMLLRFLESGKDLMLWARNGADATFASYGIDLDDFGLRIGDDKDLSDRLTEAMPQAHRDFFKTLELVTTIGDYVFVHAGLRPGIPLNRQRERDLIWIREPFLSHSGLHEDKTVVHGHTPMPEPDIAPGRIGIDTGAVHSGRLTAIVLEGETFRFLATGSNWNR